MLVRDWIDEGEQLSAGTDPIGAYAPLDTIWALATRRTESVGVQGPDYAVDRATAVWLATTGTTQLLGETERLGSLAPGHYADVVAFASDPLTCPLEELRELKACSYDRRWPAGRRLCRAPIR